MLFKRNINSFGYDFHPNCQHLEISHLCFADDLFILCGASELSFSTINHTLLQFSRISGLKPNLSKSAVFLSGLLPPNRVHLCNIIGISEGHFPVTYLGLPLIPSRLTFADCSGLIGKFQTKLNGWATSKLSYGGRLQLIKTVFYGIQLYWFNSFILPKRVISKLESILANFLWSSKVEGRYMAKVSWEDICMPITHGGLGLIRLETRNNSAIM